MTAGKNRRHPDVVGRDVTAARKARETRVEQGRGDEILRPKQKTPSKRAALPGTLSRSLAI